MKMKLIKICFLGVVFFLQGCVAPYKQMKTYDGSLKPDSEVAAITYGHAFIGGVKLFASVTGVDEKVCPDVNPLIGGYPDNICGNNTGVLPGKHRFRMLVYSGPEQEMVGNVMKKGQWKTKPFFTSIISVEAGVVYKAVPILTAEGISAEIIPDCISENHEASIKQIHTLKKSCAVKPD
ncbi:hypothetical protein [Undibacterium curvum]|uniref:hypothetical protein n=1 Tax=Undibacterium curvum TaxID=2762294 RepID=UPI003D15108F